MLYEVITVPQDGGLLVLANGAYGQRIGKIAACLKIPHAVVDFGERNPVDPERVKTALAENPGLTHVAVVHCETTTGMLNPIAEIGAVVKAAGRTYIVDAMSSFGGIPIDVVITSYSIHYTKLYEEARRRGGGRRYRGGGQAQGDGDRRHPLRRRQAGDLR